MTDRREPAGEPCAHETRSRSDEDGLNTSRPEAEIPKFGVRFRGYDRREVEEYLHHIKQQRVVDWASVAEFDDGHLTAVRQETDQRGRATPAEAEQQVQQAFEKAASQSETAKFDLIAANVLLKRLEATAKEYDRLAMWRREAADSLRVRSVALNETRQRLSSGADFQDVGPAGAGANQAAPLDEAQDREDRARQAEESATSLLPPSAEEDVSPRQPHGHFWGIWGSVVVVGVALLVFSILMLQRVAAPLPTATAEAASRTAAVEEGPPSMDSPQPISITPNTARSDVEDQPHADALFTQASDDLTLTLIAARSCWLRTQVDQGDHAERLLSPGETIVLHARHQVSLRVGDAGALSLLINDHPTKPLGADGQVVNLHLTSANYSMYLAEESDASARSERGIADAGSGS